MINLAFAEFLFALILLVSAYFISHTINGFFQAYLIDKLGDSTAKDAGYMSLNPLDHIDTFGFLALIFLGIGWLQTVPIDPYAFIGRMRYVRLFLAFAIESCIAITVATVSLFIAVYVYGYPLTSLLIIKMFTYYSKFFLLFFSSSAQLNIAALFTENHSTLSIVIAFLLVSMVYLNILIATISSIFNIFRYFLVVGFEQGYAYMDYADYLAILGPFLVVYVFGDHLVYFLLQLAEWAACNIACIF